MTSKIVNRIVAGMLSVASIGSLATVPAIAASKSSQKKNTSKKKTTSQKQIRSKNYELYYGNTSTVKVYTTYTDGTPNNHTYSERNPKDKENFKKEKFTAEYLYKLAAENSANSSVAKSAQRKAKKTNGEIAIIVNKSGLFTIARYKENKVNMECLVNTQGRVRLYHQMKNDPRGFYLQYEWTKKAKK